MSDLRPAEGILFSLALAALIWCAAYVVVLT